MPPKKEVVELIHEEVVDERKLRYCLENWEQLPLRKETREGSPNWSPIAIMTDYLRMRKNGVIVVKYRQSKNGIGRFIAVKSRSLQALPREVRHTIARDYYYDIDIVNCHPALLIQYCDRMGIPCNILRDYVENREARIQEVIDATGMSRDEIKTGMLAMVNGGKGTFGGEKLNQCPRWVRDFQVEMRMIMLTVMEREPEIAKLGKKNAMDKKKEGGFYNPEGSTINLVLCDLENKMLMNMVNYLKEKGVSTKNVVLVFDGVMLYKSAVAGYDLNELLTGMSEYVFNKTGYNISIIEKPMDKGFPIPDEYVPNNEETVIEDDENEASVKFYEIVKNDIRRCDGMYFIRNGGVWSNDDDEVQRILLDKCLRANFIKMDCVGEDVKKKNYSAKLSGAKAIVEAMLTRVPNDPDFVKNMKRSTFRKLVFKDGYYDFSTKQFTKGFDGVDSLIQINRNFPKRNDTLIEEVEKKVITAIWGTDSLRKTFLQFLARAMAGHIEDKAFAVMMGERDCGKGVLCILLMCAFGKYVDTINPENLLVGRVGNGDEAKKLSWTMRMEHTRLALTNEIKLDESAGLKLDGNMIKKIASGGDTIEARLNYKNERSFQIGATLLMCCNDLPTISPADAYQKLVPFICPHKFEENLTDEMKTAYPFLKDADPDIKRFCERDDIGDAFFWIIADHYDVKKPMMTDEMTAWRSQFNTDDEMDILMSKFHITRDPEDKVSSKDIETAIKSLKLNLTMKKFAMYVEKRGARHGNPYIDGKRMKGYTGIKKIGNDEEED